MRISERLRHKRPVFSFEFFPPKTEKGEETLWRSLRALEQLRPDFVSVTFGAGGSTQTRTIELVGRIKRELGIEPMAHLTCVGLTRDDLRRIVDRLATLGIENILTIRGDPPKGQEKFEAPRGGLRHANELVELVRQQGDFCIGAACYPEMHPEAPSPEEDLRHLKRKVDTGVDFLLTQLFFDNARFRSFEASARAIGIDVPIIPGIMPITSVSQIKRFTAMCGASIPARLVERLELIEDDELEVFWAGVMYAAQQCRELLEPASASMFDAPPPGVPGIHFYTLNRSPATRAIFELLRLARTAS
jgi:methylenetetrahydrofolate reductase (NADPH)